MSVTFEDGVQESMLPMFEMTTDTNGVVVLDSGEPAPTFNGHEPITPDEIAGFVEDPNSGETVLLRDNFCDICDYVLAEDSVGEFTQFIR